MSVKVTLKARDPGSLRNPKVESFDGENDEFNERKDGKLEIHREDGTVKVYAADQWATVDGKRKVPDLGFA